MANARSGALCVPTRGAGEGWRRVALGSIFLAVATVGFGLSGALGALRVFVFDAGDPLSIVGSIFFLLELRSGFKAEVESATDQAKG